MNEFLSYLVKSSLCTGVFYGLYYLLLRKNTFFTLNRIYLLLTLLLSLVIPIINISLSTESISANSIYNNDYIQGIVVYANAPAHTLQLSELNYNSLAMLIFILFSSIFITVYLYSVIRINLLKIKAVHAEHDSTDLYIINKEIPAFSFIKSIFVSKSIYESKDFCEIFKHEKIHIDNYHSLDLLFVSIIKSILWLNPFIYLYEKALRENHEFTADNLIINQGVRKEDYKKLMLSATIKNLFAAPVNSFSMSMIKKRFKMLNKNNSRKSEYIRYLMFIPLSAILFFAFACNNKQNNPVSADDKYAKYTEYCYFDDNGKIIPWTGYDDDNGKIVPRTKTIRRYLENYDLLSKIQDIRDLPPEAVNAGIDCAAINVRKITDKDGNVIYIKAINGKIAGGEWKSKVGYGFDEKAEEIVRNLGKCTLIENPNGIRAYEHSILRVQFGSINKWRALEDPVIKKRLLATNSKDSTSMPFNTTKVNVLLDFVRKNIKYPESCIKNNVSGQVWVAFTLNKNGKLKDVKIDKGINEDMDAEVLRVVNSFNNSGLDMGCSNDSRTIVPIEFRLK